MKSAWLTLRARPAYRLFSTTSRTSAAAPFNSGPAPPRLPKGEQELYEQLQKSSTGAFSSPKPTVVINHPPESSSSPFPSSSSQPRTTPQINQSPHSDTDASPSQGQKLENINAKVQARGDGEELHPDIRRGVKPEFEGERNPKTGETGGPKNEPLRWGGNVDWSYNGRVTDF